MGMDDIPIFALHVLLASSNPDQMQKSYLPSLLPIFRSNYGMAINNDQTSSALTLFIGETYFGLYLRNCFLIGWNKLESWMPTMLTRVV